MQSLLYLCLFAPEAIAQELSPFLNGDRYRLTNLDKLKDFSGFLRENTEHIDCLVVVDNGSITPLFNQLYEKGQLLPVVILEPSATTSYPLSEMLGQPTITYHHAEIHLAQADWPNLPTVIDQAIAQYLRLGPVCPLPKPDIELQQKGALETEQSFLLLQQRRLADKLKERLGYLGVYYKRNPNYFYRNLIVEEKQEFLDQMRSEYQEIILNYFAKDIDVNQMIDQFVNRAFFADLAISQILEIHMELMDEYSQKLKLEGRSEEVLLDYRLALIDILAHIGEMYRRSIPREDMPQHSHYQTD